VEIELLEVVEGRRPEPVVQGRGWAVHVLPQDVPGDGEAASGAQVRREDAGDRSADQAAAGIEVEGSGAP